MDLVNRARLHCGMRLTCCVVFLGMFCITPISSQIDPLALGRADPQCWESSSAILLEMRKPRISDTVTGFWDFMIYLKSSENLKHGALFWDLAQLFWDIYVDCVLSRTHGLGRRQLGVELTAADLPLLYTWQTLHQDERSRLPEKRDMSEEVITVRVQQSGSRMIERIVKDLVTKRKPF